MPRLWRYKDGGKDKFGEWDVLSILCKIKDRSVDEAEIIVRCHDDRIGQRAGDYFGLIEKLSDTGTRIGRAIQAVENGVGYAQDLAKYFNDIAQWVGLS